MRATDNSGDGVRIRIEPDSGLALETSDVELASRALSELVTSGKVTRSFVYIGGEYGGDYGLFSIAEYELVNGDVLRTFTITALANGAVLETERRYA